MQRLKAKEKADAERQEARLEKRRGYARAGRERERARRLAESGLDDLPLNIAVALEDLPAEPAPEPAPEPKPDASSEELVARLESIKERIFRLRAVHAVSLSLDAATEANRYLILFQDLAQELRAKDPEALTALNLGYGATLNSPPVPVRQSIPLDTQKLIELRWEVSQSPTRRMPKRQVENVPDGLFFMDAVERIYREISQPSPPQTKPAPVTAQKPELTRADVDAIIQRTRTTSPEKLQHIIDHAKDYRLTEGARNQLGCDLSILMAQRARNLNGRRDDPSAQFISQVLGLAETPWGMIERAWINNHLRAGSQAIMRCRLHRPPLCSCWSPERVELWQMQAHHGERSPEGFAAARILEALEGLELSSRPERCVE